MEKGLLITDSTGVAIVSRGIFEDEEKVILVSGMIDALIGFSSSLEDANIEKMSFGKDHLIAIKTFSNGSTNIHFILVVNQKEKDSDIELRFKLARKLFHKYYSVRDTKDGMLIFPFLQPPNEAFDQVYKLKPKKIKKLLEDF